MAIGSLQPDQGAAVVAEIEAAGGEATYREVDVRKPDDVATLIADAERWGHIDVLYASAGVMTTGTAEETAEEDFLLTVDVKLGGCFRLVKFGIPALALADGGSVILTGSEIGLVGASRAAAYCASKGGVVNVARALAIDAAPLHVRVNCLCPGPSDIPMMRDWYQSGDPAELERIQVTPILLKRIGRPQEIADAAFLLATDASSFMTGATLVADGGATAWYGL